MRKLYHHYYQITFGLIFFIILALPVQAVIYPPEAITKAGNGDFVTTTLTLVGDSDEKQIWSVYLHTMNTGTTWLQCSDKTTLYIARQSNTEYIPQLFTNLKCNGSIQLKTSVPEISVNYVIVYSYTASSTDSGSESATSTSITTLDDIQFGMGIIVTLLLLIFINMLYVKIFKR